MKEKPFKGKLYYWKKVQIDHREEAEKYYGESIGLGYFISAFKDTPPRIGNWWRTSWVVKHNKNGDIETRNSRYHLVGKERIL
jgi:hypothetical protein